ncbi:MAG: class I mannose-6-phosphate isomerase, partial [Mycobacteriales bacterium]
AEDLTDDPVFGRVCQLTLAQFFDPALLAALRAEVAAEPGPVVIAGTGAALVTEGDALVYADLTRREATLRQRGGLGPNLGAENSADSPALLYKRAFFVDWRVADRHKKALWERLDFILDVTVPDRPTAARGAAARAGLRALARRPLRVVPYFDPAPWGGQWMKSVCGLDGEQPNYGWCFDCVPEENSLLLGFGPARLELPALDLVAYQPAELLGEAVRARFGDEFPIRFDLLDTMGGGNLSLQVHPLTAYIREQFGMTFTQDESYYMLDAGPDSVVYLGLRTGVDPAEMLADLYRANAGDGGFDAERYVNVFPARRHDHYLIPAGTVHCSGRGGVVLEISATPYIFTFKLWDWGRPGLDGRPRPVHLDHGRNSIRWDRDTDYTRSQLVNQVSRLDSGPGWVQERTGLHEAEFIETRRHWFTGPAFHPAGTGVNVLNLVQGDEAVVESMDGGFDPFVVHYAETLIVPAAAGGYTIRPTRPGPEPCATIKAFVRGTAS